MRKPEPQPLLFKVLVEGKSCHGGGYAYPLGKWTPKIDKPSCCNVGYHLTADPLRWWRPKANLYVAAARGPLAGNGSDKAAFQSVKIGAEITIAWPWLPMLPRIRAFLAASARSIDAKAEIEWADLSGADLSWADLSGADLSGADLSWADLSGADLSGADLSGADLSWADLSWANLSGADLSGADLSGAYRPENAPTGWKITAEMRLERAT
jgi:hypothetical protein